MQKVQTLQEQESFTIHGPQLEVLGEVENKLPAPMKKRSSAALTAVALALAATFGIGGIKLSSRCAAVQAQYAALSDHGYSISMDLDTAADYAANVIRMSGNVLGTDHAEVAAAQQALDAWNATDSTHPAAQYDANSALAATLDALYRAVSGQAGAENIGSQYAQFTSQQDIIRRETNEYNEAAEEYNRMAGQFPASLIGALWGAGEVEAFA